MSEETEVVNEDLTNPTETESEQIEEEAPEEATPAAGSKTDPALLLQSLKEEREKRREAERRAKELEEQISSSTPTDEVYSDEGKTLLSKIQGLETELSGYKTESTRKDVLREYPVLEDKWTEFNEYLAEPENAGMALKTAAKSFLIENGLSITTKRKGLEKPTGGDKTPKPQGYTFEQMKNLRENDWDKYNKLLKEGAFDKVVE